MFCVDKVVNKEELFDKYVNNYEIFFFVKKKWLIYIGIDIIIIEVKI